MKKITLLILLFPLLTFAQQVPKIPKFDTQDTTKGWKFSSTSSLTISQTSLKNWAAGGENSLNISAFSKIDFGYRSNKHIWTNHVDLNYGLTKLQNKPFRKNDDKIELNSQYGFKAFNNFYYTTLLNFKTQFSPGYQYNDNGDSTKISDFLSPGYLIFSLGMNYSPEDKVDLFASFLSGKMTIVMSQMLSDKGAYGVDTGKHVRYELGAYLKFRYNKEIMKNLTLNAKVDLFSNYLHDPQNIDVNTDILLIYKAAKYLTFNIKIQTIYDHDVKIYDEKTGTTGPRLQIQEIFGLGLTFKIP